MSDVAKTSTFLGVAVVVLLVAIFSRPAPPSQSLSELARQKPLNQVDDPLAATQLEIVKYNEEIAQRDRFEVAKVDGVWSIPSHHNYPADAEQQVGEAAVATMNLKVLDVATDDTSDHPVYGVVNPNEADPASTGVGMLVTLKDSQDEALVNMIIGKQVQDKEDQHYVREVGKDAVYVVQVDTSKLSTDFEDWIEEDLLKLNPLDITGVELQDYSIEQQEREILPGVMRPVAVPNMRSRIKLKQVEAAEGGGQEWQVTELKEFDEEQGEFVAAEVPEGQVLDQQKLNDLKTALDDLKIIDVERKPAGIGGSLGGKYDIEELSKPEFGEKMTKLQRSLQQRGFYLTQPQRVSEDEMLIEILSTEGEGIVQMQDGVEYVLRFGKIAQQESAAKEQPGEEGEDTSPGVSRYLFVAARMNEDLIEKPDLQPLPGEEQQPAPKEKTDAPEKPAEGEKPVENGKPAEEKAEAAENAKGASDSTSPSNESEKKKPAGKDAAGESASADQSEEERASSAEEGPALKPANAQQAAEDEEAPAEKEGEQEQDGEAQAAEAEKKNAAESSDDTEKSAAAKQDEATAEAEQAAEDELQKQRAEVEKANQRERDAYQERVEAAQKRVDELNDRFAAWYYVISDDVYQKIHLGRKDIFQAKEAPKDSAQPGAKFLPGTGGLPGLPQGIDSILPEIDEAERPQAAPKKKPAAKQQPATEGEKPETKPQAAEKEAEKSDEDQDQKPPPAEASSSAPAAKAAPKKAAAKP